MQMCFGHVTGSRSHIDITINLSLCSLVGLPIFNVLIDMNRRKHMWETHLLFVGYTIKLLSLHDFRETLINSNFSVVEYEIFMEGLLRMG